MEGEGRSINYCRRVEKRVGRLRKKLWIFRFKVMLTLKRVLTGRGRKPGLLEVRH